jgi:hypothetical protein
MNVMDKSVCLTKREQSLFSLSTSKESVMMLIVLSATGHLRTLKQTLRDVPSVDARLIGLHGTITTTEEERWNQ